MTRLDKRAPGPTPATPAGDLDSSCGGLLPLIAPVERAPAIWNDRSNASLTREEVRAASLSLAERLASQQKRLVFLFCGANSETVIGLLAAAGLSMAIVIGFIARPVAALTRIMKALAP